MTCSGLVIVLAPISFTLSTMKNGESATLNLLRRVTGETDHLLDEEKFVGGIPRDLLDGLEPEDTAEEFPMDDLAEEVMEQRNRSKYRKLLERGRHVHADEVDPDLALDQAEEAPLEVLIRTAEADPAYRG